MSRLLTPLLISLGVLAAGVFAIAAYLMTGLIAIIAFGCVIVLAVLVLLGDFACRRYLTWREKRDRTIRNSRASRYSVGHLRGPPSVEKDQWLQ
jgi:membrane protein YdbS with pleckstrin-like domain